MKYKYRLLVLTVLIFSLLSGCTVQEKNKETISNEIVEIPTDEKKTQEEVGEENETVNEDEIINAFIDRTKSPWADFEIFVNDEPVLTVEAGEDVIVDITEGDVISFGIKLHDNIDDIFIFYELSDNEFDKTNLLKFREYYKAECEILTGKGTILDSRSVIAGNSDLELKLSYGGLGTAILGDNTSYYTMKLICRTGRAITGREMSSVSEKGFVTMADDGTIYMTEVGKDDNMIISVPFEHYSQYDSQAPVEKEYTDNLDDGIGVMGQLNFYKGEVYYEAGEEIRSLNEYMTDYTEVYQSDYDRIKDFFVFNGKFYFREENGKGENSYGVFTKTTPTAKVLERSEILGQISEISYHNGCIYFNAMNEDGQFNDYMMNLNDLRIKDMGTNYIPRWGEFALISDEIIYSLDENENKLYSVDLNNGKYELFDENVSDMIIYDGILYYLKDTEVYSYNINTDRKLMLFNWNANESDSEAKIYIENRRIFVNSARDDNDPLPVYDIDGIAVTKIHY